MMCAVAWSVAQIRVKKARAEGVLESLYREVLVKCQTPP